MYPFEDKRRVLFVYFSMITIATANRNILCRCDIELSMRKGFSSLGLSKYYFDYGF
jgi:hypothetical protein